MSNTPDFLLDTYVASTSSSSFLMSTTIDMEDNGVFVDDLERRKCRKIDVKLLGNQKRQQKQQHFAQLWPQLFVNETVSSVSALEYSQKLIPNQREHSINTQQSAKQNEAFPTTRKRSYREISNKESGEEKELNESSLLAKLERKVTSESNWSLDEDVLICEMHNQIGNDWAYIAAKLHGRNRIEVKTRFRSITRAAKRHWTFEQDNQLRSLFVNQYDKIWNDEIASHFQNRTKTSVKSHLKELMEGSLTKKVYPYGSPINVLIQRPDIHQLLLGSIKNASNSKSCTKNGEDEVDGSCASAEEDDEDAVGTVYDLNDQPSNQSMLSQAQEMTPSSQSKITMKLFNQNHDESTNNSSSCGYEHIEPMNWSYPTMKSNKRKDIESTPIKTLTLSINEIILSGCVNGNNNSFTSTISQDAIMMVDPIIFDDDEIEILMASLKD